MPSAVSAAAAHGERDLGARGNQNHVRLAVAVFQHVAAARDVGLDLLVVTRGWCGTPWRVSTRLVGPSRRSMASRQATAVSTVSQGRQTRMFGIMRRRRDVCSTG